MVPTTNLSSEQQLQLWKEQRDYSRRLERDRVRFMNTVASIAFANLLINTFRPDKDISWQVREYMCV